MYLSTMTKPASVWFVDFISTSSIDLKTTLLLCLLLLFLTYTIAITALTMSSSTTAQAGTSVAVSTVSRSVPAWNVKCVYSHSPTVTVHTVFLWSDATAFTVRFSAATNPGWLLFEGSVHFIEIPQWRLNKVGDTAIGLIDAGSSMHSLSVLLWAVETSFRICKLKRDSSLNIGENY